MGDVGILKAAHHMRDRIDLADGGEKLVAEALALRGAAHQARDIDKGQPRRNDLAGFGDLRELVEPGIRHRDLSDIRLDGAERIIRRLRRRCFRQRIEQRRLADIGQSDNPAFESHCVLNVFTSSWPGIAVRRTASLPLAYARPSTSFFCNRQRKAWMPGTTAVQVVRASARRQSCFSPPSSPLSINPFACIASCTLFWNVESLSVTSSPAFSAIASQSATTQGRSSLAKSDST